MGFADRARLPPRPTAGAAAARRAVVAAAPPPPPRPHPDARPGERDKYRDSAWHAVHGWSVHGFHSSRRAPRIDLPSSVRLQV